MPFPKSDASDFYIHITLIFLNKSEDFGTLDYMQGLKKVLEFQLALLTTSSHNFVL